jgi:RNase H-fold protein (predicted Holliday junction resolvase)
VASAPNPARRILGIDPGRAKAGFAVIGGDGAVLAAGIVAVGELRGRLAGVLSEHPGVTALALGGGTNAAVLARGLAGLGPPVVLVDEFETTRRARELYFRDHPPRGWRRLVPLGLQVPPRPVDDYAAILIARRFLDRESGRDPQMVKPPSEEADR